MKIMMRHGRVFQGTPKQIVEAMQDIAMPAQQLTLPEYIDWVAANALKFEAIELRHDGDTIEEKAATLVDSMLEAELAVKM